MPSPVMGGSSGGGGGGVGAVLAAGHTSGTSPAASGTDYVTFANPGTNGTVFTATESSRQMMSPVAGTLKNLYVRTTAAQPGDGAIVLTVRINGADTGITVTIAADATAGTFSDITHTAAVSAGDLISLKAVNASGSGGATFNQWSILIQ